MRRSNLITFLDKRESPFQPGTKQWSGENLSPSLNVGFTVLGILINVGNFPFEIICEDSSLSTLENSESLVDSIFL
jgi:hypothetical protein